MKRYTANGWDPATKADGEWVRYSDHAAEVERLERDRDRLDFLDGLNRAINSRYGTDYRWEMVINHNVNRLMCKFPYGVDLNDAKAHGFRSCRDVIDREMVRIAATRAFLKETSHDR